MPLSGEVTMNKISAEKRKQLVLVGLIATTAIATLGYLLIKPEYQRRDGLAQSKSTAQRRLDQMRQTIEHSEEIESRLCDTRKQLEKIEESMASGDLYSWAINSVRQFKLPYRVDIPQFSQIDGPREMPMLPAFPYKQAALTI